MIRMFSGLMAPVIGGLGGLFKRGEKVSAYRIVLAATFAAAGLGLWAGWAQWALFGEGLAGGFSVGCATFLARWAAAAWLTIVLLWPAVADKDDLVCGGIVVLLFACLFVTGVQAGIVHGAFETKPRTHYYAAVSCEHCGADCRVSVVIGESWTDWESVKCCRCGIKVPPERVPEYAESRGVWESRLALGGGCDGAED